MATSSTMCQRGMHTLQETFKFWHCKLPRLMCVQEAELCLAELCLFAVEQ